MSDFTVNGDMFGMYVKIPYGHYYRETGEKHIYKVISRFESNAWCEVPLTYQTEHNMVKHDHTEEVLNVIHCGIDETVVLRVALKDCDIVRDSEWKMTQFEKIKNLSAEEMADMFHNSTTFWNSGEMYLDIHFNDKSHEVRDSFGDLVEWLQSEVDNE